MGDMRIIDEDLHGRTIIAADGQVLGEVGSITIHCETWRVESLRVKLAREVADYLGAEHGLFRPGALDIPVRMIQSVGDTVLLAVPVDRLRELLPDDEPAPVRH